LRHVFTEGPDPWHSRIIESVDSFDFDAVDRQPGVRSRERPDFEEVSGVIRRQGEGAAKRFSLSVGT
jgi:hypothetical protein